MSSAEVTIGLVCISAPALRPLLKKLSGGRTKSSSASSTDQESGARSIRHKSGSVALVFLPRPEKLKSRSRIRSDDSVEQFRPNDVNRTITEIGCTGSEENGYTYGGHQDHDQTSENDCEDHAGFVVGCSHGILRKMEVAVTVSDRV